MSFANLLKKGSLRQFATATVATVATVRPKTPSSVASVATVSVATAQKQATNDSAQAEGTVASSAVSSLVFSQTPVSSDAVFIEPPADPNAWRELAAAYHQHHFACPTCITAGRGAQYGLRCGVGAALWNAYQNT